MADVPRSDEGGPTRAIVLKAIFPDDPSETSAEIDVQSTTIFGPDPPENTPPSPNRRLIC